MFISTMHHSWSLKALDGLHTQFISHLVVILTSSQVKTNVCWPGTSKTPPNTLANIIHQKYKYLSFQSMHHHTTQCWSPIATHEWQPDTWLSDQHHTMVLMQSPVLEISIENLLIPGQGKAEMICNSGSYWESWIRGLITSWIYC